MSAPELLPCPWCGPMNGHYGFTIGRFGTRLTCFCCDSHGPRAATRGEAIAAWNTRADLPAPDPRTAALVEALRESRETHCGIAEHILQGGKDTKGIFADSQRARLAIDAALAAWEA